jgi:hypothetical protein
MPNFRKRPILVSAEQFLPDGTWKRDPTGVEREQDGSPYVTTIHEQKCYITPEDWILPEPDGIHFYPVKNDIFERTYEPTDVPDELEALRVEAAFQARRSSFYKCAALSGEVPSIDTIRLVDDKALFKP